MRFGDRKRSATRCWWVVVCVVAVTLVGVLGCVTEPITGRYMLGVIPEGEANNMGDLAYKQLLEDAKITPDASQAELVERVGSRIAAVVDARMQEAGRDLYQWEFKVIDAPETVNAFALPGGKVAFYTGILPICQTEAGVAVVMGHEIAHAYGQHGRKRVSEGAVSQFGLEAVTLALGGDEMTETSKLAVAALGVGYQVGVQLPFSRGDESAADHIGLILMAEAGYDPREAPEFWKRMAATTGSGPAEFLSTHPSPETRVEQLEELMPDVLAIYEARKNSQ